MQVVIVSGLSGSGKSIALDFMEDGGYYCVDNLPATLVNEVAEFLSSLGHKLIAVSVDARSAALPTLEENIERLSRRGIDCRVLFLEATPQTLLRRFSETRRRHPLATDEVTLAEAIESERALLAGVAQLGHRIDTTDLQPKALGNWLGEVLGIGRGTLTLLFESFAFRQGIPLDADWVIDARMLPNPHYVAALRPLTGRNPEVIEFLEREHAVQEFFADVSGFLGRWLPEILRENRSYLTVAVGCTGGRHRSVYLVERLAAAFRSDWRVLVRHRALTASSVTAAAPQ